MRSSVKAAAVTAAAMPLFITACSSAATPASSTSVTPASSPSASSLAASAGTSPGDPLASLTAEQIASKAAADLKAASSFHFSGTVTTSGTTETMQVTRGTGKCEGTVSLGNGPIAIVLIGTTAWIRISGESGYLKTTTGDSSYRQEFALCDPSEVASMVSALNGLAKGGTATVNGQKVVQLTLASYATVDVTDSATPEYVRIVANVSSSEHERLDFSGINKPVSIKPPPASEVLSD